MKNVEKVDFNQHCESVASKRWSKNTTQANPIEDYIALCHWPWQINVVMYQGGRHMVRATLILNFKLLDYSNLPAINEKCAKNFEIARKF